MEFVGLAQLVVAVVRTLRYEQVHDGSGRIHLELVVGRLLCVGSEKEFENVIIPSATVLFGDISEEVAIDHVGREVEVVLIPQ